MEEFVDTSPLIINDFILPYYIWIKFWIHFAQNRRFYFALLHMDEFPDAALIKIDVSILPYYIWMSL